MTFNNPIHRLRARWGARLAVLAAQEVELLVLNGWELDDLAVEAEANGNYRITTEFSFSNSLPGTRLPGVVEAILTVGRQRNAVLNAVRTALEEGNRSKVLSLARQLCGLQTEVTCDSIDKREKSNRVN